jgi:hypothetical protein
LIFGAFGQRAQKAGKTIRKNGKAENKESKMMIVA